jgi:anthranilate 1,2-dioxygenase small subunit
MVVPTREEDAANVRTECEFHARCRPAIEWRQRGGDPRLLEALPRSGRHLTSDGERAMDDLAVRLGVHDLIAAYVDCIDEDRLEEWPDFFAEQCRYLITSRADHAAGLRHGVVYAASRGMLADRVMALRKANIFEPHRYRHVVGPIRVQQIDGGIAQAHSNFLAARIMHDGETSLFASGRYLDRIDVTDAPYRFIERIVVLDSHKIDTLLVIPL